MFEPSLLPSRLPWHTDVTLSVTAPRSNPQNQYNGHHGLCITEGQMNLVTR